LNMVERSAYNCFCAMWKLAFHTMRTKVSQIVSWVSMCSLLCTQCKKWTSIKLMGCLHTHWMKPTIERYNNMSCELNVVKKIRKNN
jgi:hypothetical protein